MRTYEVKFKILVIGQPPTIMVHTIEAPTPDRARAIAWGQVYSSKPSNGAKAKFLSVTAIKAS